MPLLMRLMALLAAILLPHLASAQLPRANHIRAELIAQSMVPPAGGVVNLAIVFTPDPGWHGYWQNPGDAGLGATFDWSLPAGITAGKPLYPVPERLVIAGLMNHVYEHQYALIVQMKLPRGIAPGTALPIRANAEWLACTDEICVPERGTLAIDLKAGNGAIAPEAQARFDSYWAKLPRPLGSEARFQIDGKAVRIGIPFPASAKATDPWFYAATENAIAYVQPQKVTRQGDMLIVETGATGSPQALEGVLSIGPAQGVMVRALPGPVASGGDKVASPAAGTGILTAFLAAVLGGLILNIMPCVFPIISLKALSLVRAGESAGQAKRDALAYTAGVVATCVALGGLLLALRAGGQAIGWAFQLQSPAILFLLLLLATAITLNLLGLFELRGFGGGQALTERGGAAGSFWTGALAAFVATPCTGPFMAAALGAALILPAPAALAIFAGLGLGLALPFLALGFVPALRNRMPRPGAWMNRFRRIMAIPMALTAAALLWLLWRQGGILALMSAAAATALLAALLWAHGRSQKSGARNVMLAGVSGLALIGFAVQAWAIQRATPVASQAGVEGARRFDLAALDKLRADGKPVFLYFTADWCLTCKVNEKAAIERDEVQTAFEKAGVEVMVGDWTNGDPAITRFLESRGRSGVPLYLFYKGKGEPFELPQVLTPTALIQLSA